MALLPLLLTACDWAVLDPRGPVGRADRTILVDSLVIMLAIVLPTIVATVAFAWWFRATNSRAKYLPDWTFSGAVEIVVWSIPAMVIILLGGVAWLGSHALDPAEPIEPAPGATLREPLEIQVVSLDWKWLFIYPHEGIASVNEVVVPSGTPLHFSITSASVWNAFFVPQIGSMIYAMNGMQTDLNLRADEPGVFDGRSAQFSGDGFSDMAFTLRSVSVEEFDAWIRAARGAGRPLDAASYGALSRQGGALPSTFGTVAPGLFDKVVHREISTVRGPAISASNAEMSSQSQERSVCSAN